MFSHILQCMAGVHATRTLCTNNSEMCQCAKNEGQPSSLEVNYILSVKSGHLCSAELQTLKTSVTLSCSIDQDRPACLTHLHQVCGRNSSHYALSRTVIYLLFSIAYTWKYLSSAATYGIILRYVKCFESCNIFQRYTIC